MTRRRLALVLVPIVVLGGLAAGALLVWGTTAQQPAATPALPPATAAVSRTTMVDTRTFPGTLGYGDLTPVSIAAGGTLTWVVPVGSTVEQGEPLFRIDEQPVIALYGEVPMYRPLEQGAEGTDVLQLEQALVDLGYATFEPDGSFAQQTADAVRAWQADLGLPETGRLERGQVVFVPGPIRIAEHAARPGDQVGERAAPALSYTSTDRQVSVELRVADRALAVVGSAVTVRLPGGAVVVGDIATVTPVVVPVQNGSEVRLGVSIALADQDALGQLDAAPVDVELVSQRREGVLAVPVAALLALAGGGYAVEVVEGDATHVVPVTTGMFAGGLVEVGGEGLAEGMRVGVPR